MVPDFFGREHKHFLMVWGGVEIGGFFLGRWGGGTKIFYLV